MERILDLSIVDNINYNEITEEEFKYLILSLKDNYESREKIVNRFIDINLGFLDFNDKTKVDNFLSEILKNCSESEIALFFEKDYENLRAFYRLKDFASNDKIEKIKKHIKNEIILESIEVSNFKTENIFAFLCHSLKNEDFYDTISDFYGVSRFYENFKYCYSVLGDLIFKRVSFLFEKYSYSEHDPVLNYFDIKEKFHFDNLDILKKFHHFIYILFSYKNKSKEDLEADDYYYDTELLFLLDRDKNRFKLSPFFLNLILSTQKIKINHQIQLFENIFNREMKEQDTTHRNIQSLEDLKSSMFIQKKDFDSSDESNFNKIIDQVKNDKYIAEGGFSPFLCYYFSISKKYIDNVDILKSSLSEKTWQFFSKHYIYNDFLLIRSLHSLFRTNNHKIKEKDGLISKDFIDSLKYWIQSLEENIKLNITSEKKTEELYPEILF